MPDFPAIGHVALTVTDLAVSRPSYHALIGARPVLDKDEGPFHHVVWSVGGTLLGIHQFPDPSAEGPFMGVPHGDIELDHVVLAVRDLAAGASLLGDRFGLASLEGGRHPAWGTANRIVPLDGAYLELVAVDDPEQATRTAFGRWIASIGDATARLVGWAARTERIDEVAGRLGLAVADGSRTRSDGTALSWRVAGIDEAASEPPLPFFIQWGAATPHPGRAQAEHAHGTVGVARLDVAGDAARLASWLGGHALPIAVTAGRPGVLSVTLSHAGGSLTLDAASLAGP